MLEERLASRCIRNFESFGCPTNREESDDQLCVDIGSVVGETRPKRTFSDAAANFFDGRYTAPSSHDRLRPASQPAERPRLHRVHLPFSLRAQPCDFHLRLREI